jgi:hypothetical protein
MGQRVRESGRGGARSQVGLGVGEECFPTERRSRLGNEARVRGPETTDS